MTFVQFTINNTDVHTPGRIHCTPRKSTDSLYL